MRTMKSVFLVSLLMAAVVFLGGCGGGGSDAEKERGELVSFDMLPEVWGKAVSIDEKFFVNNPATSKDFDDFMYEFVSGDLSDDLEAFEASNDMSLFGVAIGTVTETVKAKAKGISFGDMFHILWNLFRDIGKHSDYAPVSYKVTYDSINANGGKERLTGRLIVPVHVTWKAFGYKVPILMLQHPTQVERAQSPSKISYITHGVNPIWPDKQMTVPLGMLIAATGYIVMIPDYIGMGDNTRVHPYCHESLAYSVVDMIPAALKIIKETHLWGVMPWNETQVFLMGFSEGGYATMVAAKKLQESHPEYPVAGAACLDGPYALSGTMRNLMLSADKDFDSPYFMPYTLNGYDAIYAEKNPELSFFDAVRKDVKGYEGVAFATDLAKLMDGSAAADKIIELVRKAPTPAAYAGPASILTPSFRDALKNPNSLISLKLKENDAFTWKPKFPVRLVHHISDDSVPLGNFIEARAYFTGVAKAPQVTYDLHSNMNDSLGKSYHEKTYIQSLLHGFTWIDKLAYPDR